MKNIRMHWHLLAAASAVLLLTSGCSTEKQYPGGDDDRGAAPARSEAGAKAPDAPAKPGALPGVSDK